MNNHVEVVAALIWDNDKFMICQRPANKARGLLWEFVGGKVEPGETKEQALVRECQEELAITLSVGDEFMEVVHEYSDIKVNLTLFNATIAEGVPQKLEHNDIKWITPQEIPNYEFCPADNEILKKIKQNTINESMCWAFIFDSGRLDNNFYGEVVFKNMLIGKELCENSHKMMVSLGDILIGSRYVDIEPYVIKDEYCTIDFDNINMKTPFKDFPYCWIIENLSVDIAKLVDKRLKSSLKGYVGLSRVDKTNTSVRKQFWKNMIKSFALFKKNITCFQDPELEDDFIYLESAIEMGYIVEYDKEFEDISLIELNCTNLDCDLKNSAPTIKDIDRDLFILNFSLRQELQISGVLIWRAVNDIDKVYFDKSDKFDERFIEYPFLALYHSAQGIERIQKAIIELICKKNHIKENEKTKVYELLISHSHDKLNQWIEEQENIKFSKNCKRLINILVKFYNSVRYVRYSDEGCTKTTAPEYQLLLELKNKKSDNPNFDIKNNFGRCLGELCKLYYDLFYRLCQNLNIYAYELEYSSAAVIVYYQPQTPINLYTELKHRQNAKKEVLYWLIKKAKKYPKYSFASEEALDFDAEMIEQYLCDMIYNPEDGQSFFDEVDFLYDELCSKDKLKWKERLEWIDYIIDDSK